MPNEVARPAAERVIRWMEEGPTVLETLQRMLHEYNHTRAALRVRPTRVAEVGVGTNRAGSALPRHLERGRAASVRRGDLRAEVRVAPA
ncbi:MAG: hypothetical protein H6Q86_1397 [candidate division NC10 bacterium]|jgi:hypothetical protein|nr:hypothetical protein [candidate division NC10 bacterium]